MTMTPQQIATARQSLGMTQAQFADAIGVRLQTVGRWECGEDKKCHRKPSAQTLRIIAGMIAGASGGNPNSGLAMGCKL